MGLHFPNARSTRIANVVAGLEVVAIVVVDGSVGDSGSCHFAPRATGNVAAEDVVCVVHGMSIEIGLSTSRR